MKNLILVYITSLLISLSLSSCSDDTVYDPVVEDGMFSFEITVPSSEMRTRAYADGNTVSELMCYVYNHGSASGTLPSRSEQITIKNVDGKRGGTIGLDLPSAGVYDFVFVATSCKQADKTSKIYYDPSARTLNVNYQKLAGNDEDADCFYGVLENVSLSKGSSYKVTLRRPMAQLNIGAKDLEEYNTLASSSLKSVGVTVDGVYSTMNVMDGSVTGQPVKVSFPETVLPVGQTFPAKDASYLSMSYLLVNERRDVTVTMTAGNGTTSFDTEFKDVPLQRNHQTNIHGNLLTATNDFKVEINPGFAGSGNKDVEDPYADYDLVIELNNESGGCRVVGFNNGISVFSSDNLNNYKDSKGLVKLTWSELGCDDETKVEKIVFRRKNISSSRYKCSLTSVLKFDINKLGTTNLTGTFSDCVCLKSVPCTASWNTSTVTDMQNLFYNCSALESVDLSNFNTSKVTNMSQMFYNCSSLQSLDVSSFDTGIVQDLYNMFYGCFNLEKLDLSSFHTSNVNRMSGMFDGCWNLTDLNLSGFDTSRTGFMTNMFKDCQKLKKLDLSNFDTSNVTHYDHMFDNCYSLKELNIDNFYTHSANYMQYMFRNCSLLTSLDVSSFDTGKVFSMQYMFDSCSSLQSLDLSNFDTGKVTDMTDMFVGCSSLQSLDVSSFDTTNVIYMSEMFRHCSSLKALNLSSFDTSNVTNMSCMFSNCSSLTSLDLSNFNTSKVTSTSKRPIKRMTFLSVR